MGGTCGGHWAVNQCGYCKDTRHANWDTFGVDCAGNCSTTLKEDECGQCLEISSAEWDSCIGCDQVPNSGFEFNECGRCLDASRVDFAEFGKDCNDVCDGTAQIDECDACLSPSDAQWNSCVGCDGVKDSNKQLNACGYCIDASAITFDDYGRDCEGICDGGHYIDECGKCLLPTDAAWGDCCGGDADKKFNACGLCLLADDESFDTAGKDCAGVCNGEAALDCNGVCQGTSDVNHCGECVDTQRPDFDHYGEDCLGYCGGSASFDECGECKNSSDAQRDNCLGCDHEAFSGFELNPCALCVLATRSDFETYGQDCAGECEGSHETDACGACLMRTDAAWDSCVGCDGVANSKLAENACGMCVSTDDANFDAYGRDCTDECARTAATTHYVDECGKCLLATDTEWNACVDEDTNASDAQSGGSDDDVKYLVLIIVGVSVVALVLLCCGVFCIGWLCRKHREMNRTIKAIKEVYDPMDDNMNEQVRGPARSTPQVRGGITVLPTDNDLL